VSVASPSPATTAAPPPASETCPLCGALLGLEQEWCLRCGAAARTRLAASPSWKAPVFVLAVLAALALGVLAAALVTLAGGSDRSTTVPVTTTITTAPTQTTAPTTTTVPGTSVLPRTTTSGTVTTPGTTIPHAGLTGPSTTPRLKTPSTRAPGRTTPRVTTPTSNPLFTPTLKR
jgi:hypothetical protein